MRVSGPTIKLFRERRGWHQSDLASRAGLSRPFITQVENGVREPSPLALQAIARALEVDPLELEENEVTCPHCGNHFLV